MSELPVVPEEAIQVLRWRFGEEASNSSGIVSSRTSLRLVWGLVHSKKDSDVRDGLRMATTLSKCSSACDDNNKELAYMQSVAHLKLGELTEVYDKYHGFVALSLASGDCKRFVDLKKSIEHAVLKDLGWDLLNFTGLVVHLTLRIFPRQKS